MAPATRSTGRRRAARLAKLVLGALATVTLAPDNALFPSAGVAHAAVDNPSCWKLTVTPDDEARQNGRDEFVEYVTFDSLGFTAEALAQLGFPSVAPVEGPEDSFTAVATSEAHGELTWAGATLGDRIAGRLTWVKDGQTHTYRFTGTRYTPG